MTYVYIVDRRFHTFVPRRNLIGEYVGAAAAVSAALVDGIFALRNVLAMCA